MENRPEENAPMPREGKTSTFGWILDVFDRLNYSHHGNRKYFRELLVDISKHLDLTMSVQVQSLLSYRNNLLALVGGLVALIGLLVNTNLNKGELSFKIGFTALLLSVAFAIIQAIVVASLDIGGIQKSLERSAAFKDIIAKRLSETKKNEFGSAGKKEFEASVKEYAESFIASKKSWVTRFSEIVGNCLNVSLITAMTGLAIYYGSIVWK